VLALAGCGGSNRSAERTALLDALGRDPRTYLYYRARLWWGRDTAIRVAVLRAHGDSALVEVRAPTGRQRVRLERDAAAGTWTVSSLGARGDRAVDGPTAYRTARGPERARIAAAYESNRPCEPVTVHVSRVDAAYASATGGPACGNGASLLVRERGRWTLVSYPSAVFACRAGPPGVIRSLFGRCLIG
jgi:hypothetical protein